MRGDAMARFVREREHRADEDEPFPTALASAFDLAAVNHVLAADSQPAVERNQTDNSRATTPDRLFAPDTR